MESGAPKFQFFQPRRSVAHLSYLFAFCRVAGLGSKAESAGSSSWEATRPGLCGSPREAQDQEGRIHSMNGTPAIRNSVGLILHQAALYLHTMPEEYDEECEAGVLKYQCEQIGKVGELF